MRIYPTVRVFLPWMLEVGDEVTIGDSVLVYDLGRIRLGDRAMVSQRVHLCAGSHDYLKPDLPLLKEPIQIGSDAWICADAFVGPGVEVANGAVVGARSVVLQDVAEQTVVGGNPAKFIKHRHTGVVAEGRAAA